MAGITFHRDNGITNHQAKTRTEFIAGLKVNLEEARSKAKMWKIYHVGAGEAAVTWVWFLVTWNGNLEAPTATAFGSYPGQLYLKYFATDGVGWIISRDLVGRVGDRRMTKSSLLIAEKAAQNSSHVTHICQHFPAIKSRAQRLHSFPLPRNKVPLNTCLTLVEIGYFLSRIRFVASMA